ncbi:MAG: hypothetical protein AAGA60_18580 [Cyanobacteria bacterium P01_E01_bin.42]
MNPQSGNKSNSANDKEIHLSETQKKIDAGVKFAIAQAIERHRRLGESISIWQDGKVVTLTADKIPPLNAESEE